MRTAMSTAPATEPWLQFSVQNYFATFNWDNQAAPLQQFALSPIGAVGTPSLDWSVNQFLGAINWEGGAVSARPAAIPADLAPLAESPDLMLEDFSSLFG
jgi:hypothetical protein